MKRKTSVIISLIFLLVIVTVFTACRGSKTTYSLSDGDTSTTQSQKTEDTTEKKNNSEEEKEMSDTKVKVVMENGGEFTIELYPEYAPETVANFVKLVKEGFYDGLIFHRVVDNFMCQGGDPEGTGMGGSDETIYGEFRANGWSQNTLSHKRGVISMARSQDPNSASSQFFICYTDYCTALDGDYAAFGKVIEGMEVCDDFCKQERRYNSMGEKAAPVEPIRIKTMTIVE
ncbi:MAG: peptidylprolyl isomerase [Acutalibacteraceae bacterium]|nr:peptidylprolyl isomerase [Acutalibacteraceae bacterium]